MKFLHSLQSEWLKTKGSAASWLCLTGGFFLPLLFFAGFIKKQSSINGYPVHVEIWKVYFMQVWQYMGIFLLPLGIVLAVSLMTQIEYRNHTWKQLLTTPQTLGTSFFSKLAALLLMTLKLFVYFNIGIVLSACIPCLLFTHRLPRQALPVLFFLKANLQIFITILPVITLQYLISLNFKNFLVPLGFGLLSVITTIMLLNNWEYVHYLPYSYIALFIQNDPKNLAGINIYYLSSAYAGLFLLAGYLLYLFKKEKG